MACVLLVLGCGYQPVRSAEAEGFSVVAAPFGTPELSAVHAALAGARSELAQLGRLSSDRFPAVVIQVFYVEERSLGVQEPRAGAEQPLARGSAVALEGRAWVVDSEGGAARGDTGHVRLEQAFAAGNSAEHDRASHRGALERNARQLGRTLVRRVLGLPAGAAGTR